ncbi:MAG: class I SAM-dependent methyltransferase [Candidatus Obscuribacterales bacterium]|nr:class I SAM-dependent methyltransferase [Candidatus Obscuribacterales bacterium]
MSGLNADKAEKLEAMVADYYSKKLEEHGVSHQGVDWNSTESQELRFEQLLKVVDRSAFFSLNDLGCGYGALFDYLHEKQQTDFQYNGYDLSEGMIRAAESLHKNKPAARYYVGSSMNEADYTIASGIYNVRLQVSDDEWLAHIFSALEQMNKASKKGFSFNMLTSYSDLDRQRAYLYYADPCFFFTHCKKNFSRNVALLHDYGLYEFTILVRKD